MVPEEGQDRLSRAVPGDEPALLALRDDLARWLQASRIEQWHPGEFPHVRMQAWVRAGLVHVLRQGGAIAAAVAVLADDPLWPDDQQDAGYIHLLMVARPHHGRGLGGRVLHQAEVIIRQAGGSRARLDAVIRNRRLHQWYAQQGYLRVGVHCFDDPRLHDTCLLEKPLDDHLGLGVPPSVTPSGAACHPDR